MSEIAKPPSGFWALKDLNNMPLQHVFDLIGIVTQVRFPAPPFGNRRDWKMSVFLTAPDLVQLNGKSASQEIQFFNREQDHLPSTLSLGDVLLMRGVKRTGNQFYSMLTSWSASASIFRSDKIAGVAYEHAYVTGKTNLAFEANPPNKQILPPSSNVQLYIMRLKEWAANLKLFDTAGPGSTAVAAAQSGQRAYVDLSTVRVDQFYNVVVEITKTWVEYDRTTIYVTDYTENPFFYDQSARHQVVPDFYAAPTTNTLAGKFHLQITLFGANSQWANSKEHELVGSICCINNLNIKLNRNGGNIEGKLHGDRLYEDKVDVQIIKQTDPRAKCLIERRTALQDRQSKPAQLQDDSTLSKNQKKKLRVMEKKEQARREREALELKEKEREASLKRKAIESAAARTSNATSEPSMQHRAAKRARSSEAPLPNPNVVASHPRKPCITVQEVLESPLLTEKLPSGESILLPFMNAKFKWQVRVLDYKPERLVDFSRSLADPKYNIKGEQIPDDPSRLWEWAFWLYVEDACQVDARSPTRTKIIVNAKNAEYLLNMKACDLRRNPDVLEKLRARLFLLWGEVDEVKQNCFRNNEPWEAWKKDHIAVRNRPFQCNIEEYGVQDDLGQWMRVHRMCDTTIHEI